MIEKIVVFESTHFSVVLTESKIGAKGRRFATEDKSLALRPQRATLSSDSNSLLESLTAILSTVWRNQSKFAAILEAGKNGQIAVYLGKGEIKRW